MNTLSKYTIWKIVSKTIKLFSSNCQNKPKEREIIIKCWKVFHSIIFFFRFIKAYDAIDALCCKFNKFDHFTKMLWNAYIVISIGILIVIAAPIVTVRPLLFLFHWFFILCFWIKPHQFVNFHFIDLDSRPKIHILIDLNTWEKLPYVNYTNISLNDLSRHLEVLSFLFSFICVSIHLLFMNLFTIICVNFITPIIYSKAIVSVISIENI